jgi:hypothetical protein
MQQKNFRSTVAILVLAIFVAGCSNGCSLFQAKVKGFTDMTPKEKSAFFMGVYVKNFDETMALATKPTITEDEKKMVRVKKDILVKMKPVITAYDVIAVGGGTPSSTQETELLRFVDMLVAATVPKPATDNAGVK